MNVKKLFVIFLLLFIPMMGNTEEPTDDADEPTSDIEEPADDTEKSTGSDEEPPIIKFRNLLTFKSSLQYNFMIFEQSSKEYGFQTNRPWDFGIGLGIRNLFLGFSFSIPFLYDRHYQKSQSFDGTFNHYNSRNKHYSSGYFRYYSGFHSVDNEVDLTILSMGISREYLFNRNHSIRSAYNLDGRQTVSNGSFLLGGGLFFTAIRSDSDSLSDYRKQNVFSFGPNAGYSHTWLIADNFFINASPVLGLNCLVSDRNFSAGFQALPKFSFGYHGKTWSANIYSNFSLSLGGYNTESEYYLISGNIGISFLKRFL